MNYTPCHKKWIAKAALLLVFLLSAAYAYPQAAKEPQKPAKSLFDDTTTDSDYLIAIEHATEIIQTAYNDAQLDGIRFRLSKDIKTTQEKLALILVNLKEASPNVRNQQMYYTVLLEIQQELDAQNKRIDLGNTRLDKIKDNIHSLRKDTVLMALVKDSLRRKQFGTELLGLKEKFIAADSLMKKNMAFLNKKKRLTVQHKMALANALATVEERLDKSGISLFRNEYPFLWQANKEMKHKAVQQSIGDKLAAEESVVSYYGGYSFRGLLGLAFLLGLLGWYIFRNLNYLKESGQIGNLPHFGFKYLNRSVVLPVLVIGLNIVVVSHLYAPALFIELLQLVLLGVLSLLFRNDWPPKPMRNWLLLMALFIGFCFLDLFIRVSFVERCLFMAINILAIRYGLVQLKGIRDQLYVKGFYKYASFLFVGLNVLALLANVFGRVSLSHMLSVAAIIAVTQIIALCVLLKIILEIITLQIYTTRVKRGIVKLFDHESLSETLKKPFVLVISYMWLVVIASNLNIWEKLHASFTSLLSHPIGVGSITFTLGSILLFVVIVWIAHLLQKYVAYFFGEIDDENEEHINKRQHSKLLVTRLVVLIVGYLLAIAASGMPMDKLSIVIGALGVGIGLGLQSIVNNFVSGVILIFDRPIQVGDIIDVSSQSGRVRNIGLRTTKLDAANGAEIIIPNGNILSQSITNWTYTDNLKLVEINFTLTADATPDQVNSIILETIKSVPLADDNKPPQIFYSAMAEGNYKLLVKFWCSIYRTDETVSTMRQLLYVNFRDKGIGFSS